MLRVLFTAVPHVEREFMAEAHLHCHRQVVYVGRSHRQVVYVGRSHRQVVYVGRSWLLGHVPPTYSLATTFHDC